MSVLKKQLRKLYANQLYFELGPLMRKKFQIVRIFLSNIIAPNPRNDTNSTHPLFLSKNLTWKLYLISHITKTVCAYNSSTELRNSCIFFNSPEAETTI